MEIHTQPDSNSSIEGAKQEDRQVTIKNLSDSSDNMFSITGDASSPEIKAKVFVYNAEVQFVVDVDTVP